MTQIESPLANEASQGSWAPTHQELQEVAKLKRGQRRFYARMVVERRRHEQALAAIAKKEPPPSRFSRWFSPARTERKLVLFTLGIIVIGLITTVSMTIFINQADPAVVTPLITLAGTGLGFIGGMVQSELRSGSGDEQDPSPSDEDKDKSP